MCLRERRCVFGTNTVSSRETMSLPERQCVFRRDNVSSRETLCVPETQSQTFQLSIFLDTEMDRSKSLKMDMKMDRKIDRKIDSKIDRNIDIRNMPPRTFKNHGSRSVSLMFCETPTVLEAFRDSIPHLVIGPLQNGRHRQCLLTLFKCFQTNLSNLTNFVLH